MINVLGAVALGAAKTLILSMLSEKIVLKLTLEILEWGMQGIACLYIPVPDIKNAPVALHLYYYY